jgi:hypothetical protein
MREYAEACRSGFGRCRHDVGPDYANGGERRPDGTLTKPLNI